MTDTQYRPIHERLKDNEVLNSWDSKLSLMGDVARLTTTSSKPQTPTVKKLTGNRYLNTVTGEIITPKPKAENKFDNMSSLKTTFSNLADLINCNFDNHSHNQLFITLTYDGIVNDFKKVSKDFNNFINLKLKPYFKAHNLGEMIWIAVKELQGEKNGHSIHLHVLLKAPDVKRLFIAKADLQAMWGKGICWVSSVRDEVKGADNVGWYLTSYITNIKINEDESKNLNDNQIVKDAEGHMYEKSGRLKFYPSNKNIYSCSQNVVKPIITRASVGDHKKILNNEGYHYKDFRAYSVDINDDLVVAINNQTWSK